MAASDDWLGGYTLEELLGAAPVSKTKKQMKKESGKRGIVNKTVGAPFRLGAAIVKLPVTIVTKIATGIAKAITEVVKLPIRVLGALVSPFKKQQ